MRKPTTIAQAIKLSLLKRVIADAKKLQQEISEKDKTLIKNLSGLSAWFRKINKSVEPRKPRTKTIKTEELVRFAPMFYGLTLKEMKTLYNKLCLIHHPDKGGNLENMLNLINTYKTFVQDHNEYEILLNGKQVEKSETQPILAIEQFDESEDETESEDEIVRLPSNIQYESEDETESEDEIVRLPSNIKYESEDESDESEDEIVRLPSNIQYEIKDESESETEDEDVQIVGNIIVETPSIIEIPSIKPVTEYIQCEITSSEVLPVIESISCESTAETSFESSQDTDFESLCNIVQQNLVALEQQSDFIVCGRKAPKQEESKEQKLIVTPSVNKAFLKQGFTRNQDHSGNLIQYKKTIPSKLQKTIKNIVRKVSNSDLFNEMKGIEGGEQYMASKSIWQDIDRDIYIASKELLRYETTLKRINNVRVNYVLTKNGENVIQSKTAKEFIEDIVKYMRKYENDQEKDNEQLSQMQLVTLISQKQVPQIAKGQFLKEIMQSEWYIINPNTKTHCVSDCLALVRVYRSTEDYGSIWSYVKKSADIIAKLENIQQGSSIEQIKELSEKYKVDVIFDLKQDIEMIDRDCFLIVNNGHCCIALNPQNPRSKFIFEMCQQFNDQQQLPMEAIIPKDKPIYLVAYDWEWVTEKKQDSDESELLPYAFGMFYKSQDQEKYLAHLEREQIYDKFIDYMLQTAEDLYNNDFRKDTEKVVKEYCLSKKIKCSQNRVDAKHQDPKNKCVISFLAHNGNKSDYPIIQKALLESTKINFVDQCASGMAKISYTYQVVGYPNLYIQFVDSLNLYKGSVRTFGESMGLDVQKQDVEHSVININNYKSEIVRQNIEYYLRCDCEVLYKAMIKYDSIINEQQGFSIIKNNCLTQASLAQKIFFSKYYNFDETPMYTMPDIMAEYCQKAYKGGMCDNFAIGEFKNVISIDINSSYPYQMTKAKLPVGKAYMRNFNCRYTGQPLFEGIYRVIIEYTPKLHILTLCDIIDGKLCFKNFKDYEMNITKEEMVQAHSDGYKMFILDACVCEDVADIYGKYINEAYANRKQYKALMKKSEGEQAKKYNIFQEIEKVKMNSTYGKLGWAKNHKVSNYITSNTFFLLEQFRLGNINQIQQVNDRYTMYSGIQQSSTSHTNFMLSAYITARARLQLIEALRNTQKAGYQVIYSDTDSIYACETDKVTKELKDKYITPMLDDTRLGGFKLEMDDNVGEDKANGVFISPKLYALRGPTTGNEKVKARGVMEWLVNDEKDSIRRRKEQGVEKVTYNSLAQILTGKKLQIERDQCFTTQKRVTGDYENIRSQKRIISEIAGTITKKSVDAQGLCHPLEQYGDVQVPFVQHHGNNYEMFPTIQDIENKLQKEIQEIASEYCVIRHEQDKTQKFVIFYDSQYVQPYLEYHNQEQTCHQIFGDWMIPSFDIDYKPWENQTVKIKIDIQTTVTKIAEKLMINADELQLIDRSRETDKGYKYSFHIRAPEYVARRLELQVINMELRTEELKKPNLTLISYIDGCIYRKNGQLRITDNNIFYRTSLKQIQIKHDGTLNQIQKANENVKNKVSTSTGQDFRRMTEEYLQKNNIVGWTYREAKINKSNTIVSLNRSKGAQSFCTICNRNHEKDNSKYLIFTAKTVKEACWKKSK